MARNDGSIMELVQFVKVENDSVATKLADKLMMGEVLCLDFTSCPIEEGKTVLHFLSGVNYATDGMVKPIQKNIFLFGLKEHFKDPRVKDFINQYSRKK